MFDDKKVLQAVFHDVLNLTAGAQLGLGLLRRKLSNDPSLLSVVETSESLLYRANKLLTNLLDCGEVTNHAVDFNIREILEDILMSYRLVCEEKRVSLKFYCPTVVQVHADPINVARILDNLISNALEHSNADGLIEVKIKTIDGKCNIKISDTGCGIPKEHLKNIFKPYWKKNSKGRGLGLHIVNTFVQMNGGHLSVSSVENQGTFFEFTLPLNKN